MSVDRFFSYARERYRILLRRDGRIEDWTESIPKSGKWTNDPILQQFRFCNVFREDDKTTAWIRQNIRDPLRSSNSVLAAMIIARWFNRIETLDILVTCRLLETTWVPEEVRAFLKDVHPLVTGAYMVKTPAGMNKLDGILWCLDQILSNTPYLAWEMSQPGATLEAATKRLAEYPYLGPFMAYEIVTDLRHTRLLDTAPDIMTWANPGPGAVRGAGRVCGGGAGYFSRTKFDQDMVQSTMKRLLTESQQGKYWPDCWPKWEMRDVEHTLCEFDKYERARLGEGRPKQRYDGGTP